MEPTSDLTPLFEAHGAFVSRLARAVMGDEHAAEDLAQETWAAAAGTSPAGIRNVRAWLSAVLMRRAASHRRRRQDGLSMDSVDVDFVGGDAADEALERLEAERLLQGAVRALREPYRTTIVLRYHGGLPPRAIAARTEVPLKTVKTRLSRGLAQLREELDRRSAEGESRPGTWRVALAPLVSLRAPGKASIGPVSTSALLLTTMKKLLVAATALALLLSIGYLVLRPPGPGEDGASAHSSEEPQRGASARSSLSGAEAPLDLAASDPARAELLVGASPAAKPLDSATTLTVEVEGPGGEPVQGRQLILRSLPWSADGEPEVGRVTDAEGRVRFDLSGPGGRVVEDAYGSAGKIVEFEPGLHTVLRWSTAGDVTVRGQVVDDRGAAVAGATIWCLRDADSGRLPWPIGRSDAAGAFVLRCGSGVGLIATLDGLLPSGLLSVAAMPESRRGVREANLVLGGRGSRVTGDVVDGSGRPVAGAEVRLAGAPSLVTTSDGSGRFSIPGAIPSGSAVVTVRARGFAALERQVTVDERPLELKLTLIPGVRVAGVVLRPDGTPAAKAHVWISAEGMPWRSHGTGMVPSTRCDGEGRFVLERVVPGAVTLRAESGWAGPLARADVVFDVGPGGAQALAIELEFGRTIHGVVVDPELVPIGGVVVTAFNGELKSNDLRTDANGRFALTALPAAEEGDDRWDVVVRTWTGTSVRALGRVEGAEPGGPPLELIAQRAQVPSARLVGRIASDGGAIPEGIVMTLSDREGSGGIGVEFDRATGAFEAGPLVPGTYRLELFRAGAPAGARSGLVLGADETIDVGALGLDVGGRIEVSPGSWSEDPSAARAQAVGPGGQRRPLPWDGERWRSVGVLEPGAWQVEVEWPGGVAAHVGVTVIEGVEVLGTLDVGDGGW